MTVSVKQVNVDSEGNDIWSLGTGWSIEDGVATVDAAGFLIQNDVAAGISGETHELTYTISSSNDGSLQLAGGNNPFGTQNIPSADGTHTLNIATKNTAKNIQFYAKSFRGSIDNVSAKKLNDGSGLVTGATFVADN